MAPVRPNRDLCVPLQTKTRPRPLADTARNGSCRPDACFALHTIVPAAHDANKASKTKNGRDAIPNDRVASLARMREAMLTGPFVGGFFIGGMEGVEEEFAMFSRFQPGFPAFPIASTGAAAAKLFDASPELQRDQPELRDELSYLTLMRQLFAITQSTDKPRAIVKSGVRRVGHAAALLSSMSSIPSLNLTPSMSFASWRNPRSRRQDFSAHRPIL